MFCAASNVLMAATLLTLRSFNALMKLKMVVNAGVVRSGPLSTFQIGVNPNVTVSPASPSLSNTSQRMAHTDDSLHQQPKLPAGDPGGVVAGLLFTLNVLEHWSFGQPSVSSTNESRVTGSLSTMAPKA